MNKLDKSSRPLIQRQPPAELAIWIERLVAKDLMDEIEKAAADAQLSKIAAEKQR